MPPATATIAPTNSACTANSTLRSSPTRTPSAAAVSGPADRASRRGLNMNIRTTAGTRTSSGSSSRSHCAPDTEPSIQNNTDCAERESGALNTSRLATAENADDSTTPDRISRSGVMPPWSIVTKYTVAVAAIAPTKAPPDNAQMPKLENAPRVITAVAPTLAPEEMPSR